MTAVVLQFLLLILCMFWAASAKHLDRIPGEIDSISDTQQVTLDPSKVITLSWHPRAFLYEKFLTDEECDHIKNLARGKLTKSKVIDSVTGKSIQNEVRTSSGMFLSRGQDHIVKRIEDKIAAWTFLPPEHGESIQVLKYEYGQRYGPHTDSFIAKTTDQALGGRRFATVIMYLSDVIKGGETVFPVVEERSTFKDDSWSACGKQGLAVKPRKGNALLFFSLHPNASTLDFASLHMGCPVVDGEKWSATKWIHIYPFEPTDEGCYDKTDNCGDWAAFGECVTNAAYMIGTESRAGACMKSCKVC